MDEPTATFPSFVDPRGTLVPIELGSVGFDVRRVFTVVGPPGGSTRGEHAAICRELIVLAGGAAEVTTGLGPDARTVALDVPGSAVSVVRGEHVHYTLRDDRSVLVVLADEPYRAPTGHEEAGRR